MKYSGKFLLVIVIELFVVDLGFLWGLGCCFVVLRVERLIGLFFVFVIGFVGFIGNFVVWGFVGILLGFGMFLWGCFGFGSIGIVGLEGFGGFVVVFVGFCFGIFLGFGISNVGFGGIVIFIVLWGCFFIIINLLFLSIGFMILLVVLELEEFE